MQVGREYLQHVDLLFFEDGPWEGLSQLAHTKPADWTLPAFQSVVFGAP